MVKAEWQWLLFPKNIFYVTSGLADMTLLKFQLRISFLFYVGLSHNLVKGIWAVHMTLSSYKMSCYIEGHVDLWGRLQGACIFFLNRWICQFITPSISLPNHFKSSSVVVEKGTSSCKGITSSILLNWDFSVIYYRIELKSASSSIVGIFRGREIFR